MNRDEPLVLGTQFVLVADAEKNEVGRVGGFGREMVPCGNDGGVGRLDARLQRLLRLHIPSMNANLMLGTWQENQMNEVFILDMQNLDGSQNVRYGARFYLGAQIAVGEDITYWGA